MKIDLRNSCLPFRKRTINILFDKTDGVSASIDSLSLNVTGWEAQFVIDKFKSFARYFKWFAIFFKCPT